MQKQFHLRIATLLVPAFSLSLAVSGCRGGQENAPGATAPQYAAVAVVQRGTISHVLSLAGQFQPYQVVDVHAKVSGYMRHIFVDIGDKVREGQTLGILEVPELSAQYRSTQSEQARSKDYACTERSSPVQIPAHGTAG